MMVAFHNDPAIQAKYLNRVEAHYRADEIVKGAYWSGGKGCAVGCVLHDSGGNHFRYETDLGIPVQLAHLEDAIFENLPNSKAKDWPPAFMSAIPLGADLSGVWPRFAAWLMTDPVYGVEHTTADPEVKELCREVARRYLVGETTGPEATALGDRLRDTWAARAAWAAWDARDARDAWAAWDAMAALAARTAWAAMDEFVEASADTLLRFLMEQGTPE